MLFGIASKKEMLKEFEKVRTSFKERDEKIEKLKDLIQNNALKIATLEGAYSLLSSKSQSQVSVSNKSQESLKQSQAVSGRGLEAKLIQRIKHNKKSLIMAEIMKLLPTHTTTETFEVIVKEKNLCSKASFYRYLESLKSQKLVSQEPKLRLNWDIMKKDIKTLTTIMSILHDLKHKGNLPEELNEYRDFIECYNPEKF